jgi:hypothetical protein
MSTSAKVITALVIILAIFAGIQYMNAPQAPIVDTTSQTASSTDQTQSMNSQDSSDAALDQDLVTIDAQLQVSDQDNAKVGESLSDTPVQQ